MSFSDEKIKIENIMKEISDCVFYAAEKIVRVNQRMIDSLKERALVAKTVRSRMCMHPSPESDLHEMMIVHFRNTYVRPHKHVKKSESIHMVEGTADLVFFDGQGEIMDVIEMGEYKSGKNFYYRMNDDFFHTILIGSEVCIFHETTKGPFVKERDTVLAPWTPVNEDTKQVVVYMNELRTRVNAFKAEHEVK